MKNFKFILIFLCCYVQFGFQDANIDEAQPTPEQIKELLSDTEILIDKMLFDKAYDNLTKALKYSKRIENKRYIALTSSILSRWHHVRHEYDKGITELERAISIQREIDDQAGLAYSYIMYGKLFNSKGNTNRAIKYFNLARRYYEKQNNTEQLGIISLNRAISFIRKPDTRERAKVELNNGLIYLENSENKYELSRLHYYLSRLAIYEGEYKNAEKFAKEALKIAQTGNFTAMNMYTYG
ncbi:MAG: tetratricopeptide repeat protein, partial [Gramella sp.]|nr:tetratricopeptide repeat protein [Christiangramia sp.]